MSPRAIALWHSEPSRATEPASAAIVFSVCEMCRQQRRNHQALQPGQSRARRWVFMADDEPCQGVLATVLRQICNSGGDRAVA